MKTVAWLAETQFWTPAGDDRRVLDIVDVVAVVRLGGGGAAAVPDDLLLIDLRDKEGQEVLGNVVRHVTTWLVDAAEVVKVAALAKGQRLVAVLVEALRLAWQIDQALLRAQLLRSVLRMLLCWRRCEHGLDASSSA